MSDKIVEAITEQWGERCPDFDADCACCQVWAEYDALADNRDGTRTETMTEVNDEMVLAFCRAYLPAPPDMMSAKEAASIRNHVRAALAAALASAPKPRVKALDWREHKALGRNIKTVAHDCFGGEFRRFDMRLSEIPQTEIDAAQADYERRVLSALEDQS